MTEYLVVTPNTEEAKAFVASHENASLVGQTAGGGHLVWCLTLSTEQHRQQVAALQDSEHFTATVLLGG